MTRTWKVCGAVPPVGESPYGATLKRWVSRLNKTMLVATFLNDKTTGLDLFTLIEKLDLQTVIGCVCTVFKAMQSVTKRDPLGGASYLRVAQSRRSQLSARRQDHSPFSRWGSVLKFWFLDYLSSVVCLGCLIQTWYCFFFSKSGLVGGTVEWKHRYISCILCGRGFRRQPVIFNYCPKKWN